MRVFVAGGTGVLGRRLVPQLVARGHQVTATTTSAAKLGLLAGLGADGVVMDGLDAMSVGEAVAAARPDRGVRGAAVAAVLDRVPDPGQRERGRGRGPGGLVINTLALDILDGRIQAIRSVANPDKLGHVGPVADAWAVSREAQRARRADRPAD